MTTLQLDVLLTPGFRGAGPVMRVTGSAGQVVTELDGQPVQQPVGRGGGKSGSKDIP